MQDYQLTKLDALLKDLRALVDDEKRKKHFKNCEKYRFICDKDKGFRYFSDEYQKFPTSQVRSAIRDCEAIVNFFEKVKSFSCFSCSAPENEKAQLDLLIRLKEMEKVEMNALAKTMTLINDDDLMIALNQKVNEMIANYHERKISTLSRPEHDEICKYLAKTKRSEYKKHRKGKRKEKFWTKLSKMDFAGILGHKTVYAIIGALFGTLFGGGLLYLTFFLGGEVTDGFEVFFGIIPYIGIPIGILMGLIIEKRQLKKAEEMQREWNRLVEEEYKQKMNAYNEKLDVERKKYFKENDFSFSDAMPDLSVCKNEILDIAQILLNFSEEMQRIFSGWVNYDEETLKAVRDLLNHGRADTVKEGLNLYLAEKQRKQDMQMIQNALSEMEAQVEAEKKKNLSILNAVAVALKNQNETNQRIAESQLKQKELLESANREFEETKRKQQEIINELEKEERQRKELLKRL